MTYSVQDGNNNVIGTCEDIHDVVSIIKTEMRKVIDKEIKVIPYDQATNDMIGQMAMSKTPHIRGDDDGSWQANWYDDAGHIGTWYFVNNDETESFRSVRNTVLRMLTEYPSLFKNKTDCFKFLFFTNGNGYFWKNGELASVDETPKIDLFYDENAEVAKEEKNNYDIGDKWRNSIRMRCRRYNNQIQFALDNADIIMNDELSLNSSSHLHYSGWDYSLMMQAPDDIKDDWREAISDMVFELGSYLYQKERYTEYNNNQTTDLKKDLPLFKEKLFPEVNKRQKEIMKALRGSNSA